MIQIPGFYLSAAHKSSGKTTLAIGLSRAMSSRGRQVQTFKKGPDYIDPLWMTSATGRDCFNLDFYTQSVEEILRLHRLKSQAADLFMVEGNKGLYDGLDLEGSDSNAALAKLLDVPIVLVIDTQGITRGIAPLLLGYLAFDPELRVEGVILNKVGGERHQSKLIRVIEHYTDLAVFGAVPRVADPLIEERHLGLAPSNEQDEAEQVICAHERLISEHVDVGRIEETAGHSSPFETVEVMPTKVDFTGLRIGYPRDKSFAFYYPDDLDQMRMRGVELIRFDATQDSKLPDVDGLLIGGGFPEVMMEQLSANQTLMQQISDFIENDGPVYAECGGLMYLSRSLSWGDKRCRMVGVIPADAVMHTKPQGRGYVRLRETENHPWPRSEHSGPIEIKAHEFHYSALQGLDESASKFGYDVIRGQGIDGRHDGYCYKNLVASYTHRRGTGEHGWVERFLAHVMACKENRKFGM